VRWALRYRGGKNSAIANVCIATVVLVHRNTTARVTSYTATTDHLCRPTSATPTPSPTPTRHARPKVARAAHRPLRALAPGPVLSERVIAHPSLQRSPNVKASPTVRPSFRRAHGPLARCLNPQRYFTKGAELAFSRHSAPFGKRRDALRRSLSGTPSLPPQPPSTLSVSETQLGIRHLHATHHLHIVKFEVVALLEVSNREESRIVKQ